MARWATRILGGNLQESNIELKGPKRNNISKKRSKGLNIAMRRTLEQCSFAAQRTLLNLWTHSGLDQICDSREEQETGSKTQAPWSKEENSPSGNSLRWFFSWNSLLAPRLEQLDPNSSGSGNWAKSWEQTWGKYPPNTGKRKLCIFKRTSFRRLQTA